MKQSLSEAFTKECHERTASYPRTDLDLAARAFMRASTIPKYSYNFTWLSRPIIQYPQDMAAMQEVIWSVRPDLIIETGIAHGGSLIFHASMLALLDYCDALETGQPIDPRMPKRRVTGVDIDIRAHNRAAIEAHPLANRIDMIQGSSVAPEVIQQVYDMAKGWKRILVCHDSNHTHDHVLQELEAYAPLTSPGSYCVVFDTVVEEPGRSPSCCHRSADPLQARRDRGLCGESCAAPGRGRHRRRVLPASGLIAFGPAPDEYPQLAARYADQILRGARPGDLTVEQTTRFNLVINLKADKALGPTILPGPALARGRGHRVTRTRVLTGSGRAAPACP